MKCNLSNIEEAREFIREYTSLPEVAPWKFLISEASEWMNWEIIPKQYLIIE